MSEAKLSIIIVNYNTKEILKDCLSSVFNTINSAINIEVIVIDNASTDGSTEMVKKEFPLVKLILNKENSGFARAINQGLEESRGQYKLLLNSDTVLLKDAAKTMLEFLEKNPSAGAVRPRIFSTDGKEQRQGSGFLRFLKDPNTLYKLKWVSGCCMMIRDEVIKNTGLFDENFFFYNEDVDYSRRMKRNGWELYYFPQASVIHTWGASSKNVDKLLAEQYRSKCYYYQKHYGGFILFLYKILVTFKLLIKTCLSLFSLVFLLSCFINLHAEIRVGEKLTYNVKMGMFSAGTQVTSVAEKTMIDSRTVYHIISHTKTNPFFSMFYKMDNLIEAFMDEDSLSLRKLTKNLNEGSFRQKSVANLDLEGGWGQIVRDNSSPQIFEVPSFVLDIVSLPYYLRSIELELNQKIPLNILTDYGVKVYESKVEARENVNTRRGKFDTFKIVENKEKIKVWISTDSQRLPVKIVVGTNFGEIVGILEKIE